MAKLAWAILCQRALIDTSNSLSLIEVLEEVTLFKPLPEVPPDKTPLIPLQFSLVCMWHRSEGGKGETIASRIRLIAPNGKKHELTQHTVDLVRHPRVRAMSKSEGLPFWGSGVYRFVVQYKAGSTWRTAGEVRLDLKVADPPANPAVPATNRVH